MSELCQNNKIRELSEIKQSVYEAKQKKILEAKSNYQEEYKWMEELFVSAINHNADKLLNGAREAFSCDDHGIFCKVITYKEDTGKELGDKDIHKYNLRKIIRSINKKYRRMGWVMLFDKDYTSYSLIVRKSRFFPLISIINPFNKNKITTKQSCLDNMEKKYGINTNS